MKFLFVFSLAATATAWLHSPSPAYSGRAMLNGRARACRPLFSSSQEVDIKHDASTSSVEVTINITGKQTEDAYSRVIADASRNLSIPGFRKGAKIPANVVETVLDGKGGKELLRKQALKQLLSGVVEQTLKDHPDVDPVGQPTLAQNEDVLVKLFTPGEEMQLKVNTDVWPEVSWSDSSAEKPYEGLEASYSRKPFNQEKMDMAIKDLKDRQANLAPKEGDAPTLEMGDACVVNMVGYMADENGGKGEPLPNAASGDQVDVVMEKGKYMEGLVEGLVGAKKDDVRQVTVEFPTALRDKTLAGKTAVFDVTVLSVDTRTIPELDDAFAENIRPGLTADGLMDQIKMAVDEEDERASVNDRNSALEKSLAKRLDMVIPDTLVTMQCKEKFAIMLTEMRDNGSPDEEIKKLVSPENFVKYKEVAQDNVIRDLKASMAIEHIAKMESINVPPEDVEEQMGNLKLEAEKNGEEFDDGAIRGKVEATLMRRYVMDFLASSAKLDIKYEEPEEFNQEIFDQIMKDQGLTENADQPS